MVRRDDIPTFSKVNGKYAGTKMMSSSFTTEPSLNQTVPISARYNDGPGGVFRGLPHVLFLIPTHFFYTHCQKGEIHDRHSERVLQRLRAEDQTTSTSLDPGYEHGELHIPIIHLQDSCTVPANCERQIRSPHYPYIQDISGRTSNHSFG